MDSCFTQFKLDYSKTKDVPIGNIVSSEDLSTGGHLWRINCYPRGDEEKNNSDYLSIYLKLMSKSKKVKAVFDAFVMEKDGAPSSSHSSRCVKVYPPDGHDSWGWPQFVKRSILESLYLADGWFTITWGVIVVCDPFDLPPSNIGSHLGQLLDGTDGSDVSFVVDGEKFPAHRAVLAARSPVFKAQLLGSMADAKMSSITMHDITPETFRAMLRFMYTDACPADDELGDNCSPSEMFLNLLVAADRFALDRLKLLCAMKLWDNVSVETVADTLACAETYNCPELKKLCMDFFAENNFKKAVLTDGFIQLGQKFPSILPELRERVGANQTAVNDS